VEFNDFVERHDDLDPGGSGGSSGAGGSCGMPPAAGEVDGDYMFSLVAKQSPKKPAPLRATLTTTDGGAGLEFTLDLQPLDAEDRSTEVGTAFSVGPFPVQPDGTFEADWGTITVPGATNPLSPSDLSADLLISGSLCASDFFCGAAAGDILEPVMLNIDGSSWTMESLETFMEPPKLNCAGDLADPL
jgi:hypothetical protein